MREFQFNQIPSLFINRQARQVNNASHDRIILPLNGCTKLPSGYQEKPQAMSFHCIDLYIPVEA